MSRKQQQLEICNAMLDSNTRLCGCMISDKEIAITINGYFAYVFDVDECIFDINKIPMREGLKKFFDDSEQDEVIERTSKMFSFDEQTVIMFQSQNFKIFVSLSILNHFKNCKLYANGQQNRIIAKDAFDRVLGILLPMRVREEWLE